MSCQIKTAVKVVQGPLFFERAKHIIFSDLKKKLRNVWQSIHDFLHERSLLHKLTLPLTVSLEGIKGGN